MRQAKGLSQQALCAGDGISAGYVSLIESGQAHAVGGDDPAASPNGWVSRSSQLVDEDRAGRPDDEPRSRSRSTSPDWRWPTATRPRRSDACGRCDLDGARQPDRLRRRAWCWPRACSRPGSSTRRSRSSSRSSTLPPRRVLADPGHRVHHAWRSCTSSPVTCARARRRPSAPLTEIEAAGLEGTDEHIRLGARCWCPGPCRARRHGSTRPVTSRS